MIPIAFPFLQSISENKRLRYECRQVARHRYLLSLTIREPCLADGGLYRCNAFNPFGDSNANIDLNFESENCKLWHSRETNLFAAGDDDEEEGAEAAEEGIPPTFTEKPRIIPNETGSLVTMRFKVRE